LKTSNGESGIYAYVRFAENKDKIEEGDMSGKEMDRREFLKSSATGLGAFVFLPPASQRAGLAKEAQQRDPKNYPQRVLGKTGIRLPVKVCNDCETCPVGCPSGFPVAKKIADVMRLKDVPPEFIA
jgi:anaerobic selenocysteine-containing dehydrogenase